MNIKPLGDNIIVRCIPPKDRTDAGILLPNTSKFRPTDAVVVSIGPGRLLKNGKRNQIFVEVGDEVLISFSGIEILNDHLQMYRLITIQDVLAIKK